MIYIIRVGDGHNFNECIQHRNIWGFIPKWKSQVVKMKKGDVLMFLTSKDFGGNIVGIAEYETYYDRRDEHLIQVGTYSNRENRWYGYKDWDIQIHFRNLYKVDTTKLNIQMIAQANISILNYDTFLMNKHKHPLIPHDLVHHYNNFKLYGTVYRK